MEDGLKYNQFYPWRSMIDKWAEKPTVVLRKLMKTSKPLPTTKRLRHEQLP